MKIKLSDFVANVIATNGVKSVFGITGGSSLHLMHSIADHPDLNMICPLHEQAAAMAADGYSRVTRNLGVAIGTSGPGATNMITGICCSYYDSIPVLYISGQVSTLRLKLNTGVRQYGFQETDVVSICKTITKYAVTIKKASKIRYELEKAIHIAKSGRPGPVLIDIPDNLSREEVDPSRLEGYIPSNEAYNNLNLLNSIKKSLPLIYKAKRPVIIIGWGVRLANADNELHDLIKHLGFPVAPTWSMADFLPYGHDNLVGTFGTHGTRYGNFTVQNADLILAIGTRLNTHITGHLLSSFARSAKKIVVDIDANELKKYNTFGMSVDHLIESDAKEYIHTLLDYIDISELSDITQWKNKIKEYKYKYNICPELYYKENKINPYVFVKDLSAVSNNKIIFIDTGCSIAWMMQAFKPKSKQRLFHDYNNTAMGYALPASIGAAFALPGESITCIVGDGSLQMNIQEMATVIHYNLPIKIILLNNQGYNLVRQTQDQWFDSNYIGSSSDGGVANPDYIQIAKAYGYQTFSVSRNRDVKRIIKKVLDTDGPVFCEVSISSKHRVVPLVGFGRPIEDADPLIDRDVFKKDMLIDPLS